MISWTAGRFLTCPSAQSWKPWSQGGSGACWIENLPVTDRGTMTMHRLCRERGEKKGRAGAEPPAEAGRMCGLISWDNQAAQDRVTDSHVKGTQFQVIAVRNWHWYKNLTKVWDFWVWKMQRSCSLKGLFSSSLDVVQWPQEVPYGAEQICLYLKHQIMK